MALQWIILTYVVAAEAATAILLTVPTPKLIKSKMVSLVSLVLQPSLFIVPFSVFQLMGEGFVLICLAVLFAYNFVLAFSFYLLPLSLYISGYLFFNFILKMLIDIYWKQEHRLMCTGETCTASERDRYEKSVTMFFFF